MVGARRFEAACELSWQPKIGPLPEWVQGWSSRTDPDDLAGVPHDLSDRLWYEGDESPAERYAMFLELYRRMPTSGNCFYMGFRYDDLTRAERDWFWAEVAALLDEPDERLAGPMADELEDWFDRGERGREAWVGVTRLDEPWERRIGRVLESSRPAPFAWRLPLYERLVPEGTRWHRRVFVGLLFSQSEYLGTPDEEAARRLLARLEIPEDTRALPELREALGV